MHYNIILSNKKLHRNKDFQKVSLSPYTKPHKKLVYIYHDIYNKAYNMCVAPLMLGYCYTRNINIVMVEILLLL